MRSIQCIFFTNSFILTLALPSQPAAMLTALRGYFSANPAHENIQAGITAVAAESAAAAIDAALVAVGGARRELVALKAQRDRALKTLRRRLSGLRAELEQLLEDDSAKWYEFGFKRPADGRKPAPVEEVTVTVAAPGVVLVKWEASPLAEGYRVSWKPEGADPTPRVDRGLIAGTQATLSELPLGVPIIIGVSARNPHGESKPTERVITL